MRLLESQLLSCGLLLVAMSVKAFMPLSSPFFGVDEGLVRSGAAGRPVSAAQRRHGVIVYSSKAPQDKWKQDLMDDGIDIDQVIEENKEKLPTLGPLKMKGLKGSAEDDEESRKNRQNEALRKWLGDNGVYMSDLSGWGVPPHPLLLSSRTMDEIEGEDSGRGLICKDPINMGNALFQLPLKIIMDKDKALTAFEGVLPDDINEFFALAMLLVKEKGLGTKSFWAPYMDVLPTKEEVNPTLVWSDDELAMLEGSSLVAATKSLKKKLKAEYDMLKSMYMDGRPDLFPPEVFTFDEYLWAFIMIFSRGIRVRFMKGEQVIMCPYADLINHNPYANTYIVAERPFKPFNPIRGDEVITIYADKDYKKMEQVYISYGPKSNSDLLLLYGFCLDRNPFNSVEIRVSLTQEGDPMYEEKLAFLQAVGRRESELFPLFADRYPNELLEYLRLVYLTPEEMAGRRFEEIEFADPISLSNELAALDSIEQACMEGLKSYGTSEEDDAKLINDTRLFAMLGKTNRMAIKHRRSEKRLLKKTAAAVKQQILNLKSGRRPLRPLDD